MTINDKKAVDSFYDNNNFPWELICSKEINDNTVLIGVFSTAQFSPKELYNIEPYIIFLYKIIKPVGIDIKAIDEMTALLKNTYRNKTKIIIPNNIDEFIQNIANIL